jgi:hypothetical protein
MSEAVPLRLLSRRELENVILVFQGFTSKLNSAIEEFTRPEWRVRRETDRVQAEFGPRVQFVREVADQHHRNKVRATENERYWRDLEGEG